MLPHLMLRGALPALKGQKAPGWETESAGLLEEASRKVQAVFNSRVVRPIWVQLQAPPVPASHLACWCLSLVCKNTNILGLLRELSDIKMQSS